MMLVAENQDRKWCRGSRRPLTVLAAGVLGTCVMAHGTALAQEAAAGSDAKVDIQTSETQTEPAQASGVTPEKQVQARSSSLSFEIRTDLQSDTYKNLPETNEGDDKALLFRFQRARVGLKGEIADNLKYRVRLRFDRGLNPKVPKYALVEKVDLDEDGQADDSYVASVKENTHIENVGDALDLAFLDFQFSEWAGLEVGRFNTNICGADVSSSMDAYGELALALKKCSPTFTRTGAGLYVKPLKGQRVELVAANQTDTFEKNQDQPMLGFMYTGTFADGMFEPRATLHLIPKREIKAKGASTATKKEAQDLFWNLGTDMKLGGFAARLDYASYLTADTTAAGPKAGDSLTTSLVGRLSYRIDAWEPVLSVASSTDENKSVSGGQKKTVKTDALSMTAALQYYPTSWKKFRFHAAYSASASKADSSGAKEQKTDTFLIGTALVTDLPIAH